MMFFWDGLFLGAMFVLGSVMSSSVVNQSIYYTSIFQEVPTKPEWRPSGNIWHPLEGPGIYLFKTLLFLFFYQVIAQTNIGIEMIQAWKLLKHFDD